MLSWPMEYSVWITSVGPSGARTSSAPSSSGSVIVLPYIRVPKCTNRDIVPKCRELVQDCLEKFAGAVLVGVAEEFFRRAFFANLALIKEADAV
jgi:hypothetical protein